METVRSSRRSFLRTASAAATENFMVLENHAVDRPEWGDIVANIKPIIDKGYVNLPTGPGLGITLDEDAIKKSLGGRGYFEPTPQWDLEQMNPGRGGPAAPGRGPGGPGRGPAAPGRGPAAPGRGRGPNDRLWS